MAVMGGLVLDCKLVTPMTKVTPFALSLDSPLAPGLALGMKLAHPGWHSA